MKIQKISVQTNIGKADMMAKSKEARKYEINKNVATKKEGKKVIKCEICDYSFSKTSSLKIHVTSVHENKKSFICDIF